MSRAVRFLSKKASDNVVLADALNLLTPAYRPSLLKNLTNGPATEQYRAEDVMNVDLPTSNIPNHYVTNLLHGLQSSPNSSSIFRMSPKELSHYIKAISDTKELNEILLLLQYQNHLSLRVLTDVVLNRHFSLKDSPVDVLGLKWKDPLQAVQFNIILLKKYHDLRKPLLIIKNLKENFNAQYFPLIKQQKLSPFYERIVWKFNFEYIKFFDEIHYINTVNSIKSSFLIWESSTTNNAKIARHIANRFELTEIQALFLRLAYNDTVQERICGELEHLHSNTLSSLKKLSIRYKLYNLGAPSDENRLAYYSLVNSMENIVLTELMESEDAELAALMRDIKEFRRVKLVGAGAEAGDAEAELKWVHEGILRKLETN